MAEKYVSVDALRDRLNSQAQQVDFSIILPNGGQKVKIIALSSCLEIVEKLAIELNGEPNTRALDERVKELREWIGNLRKWLDDTAMLRQFSAYGSAGASMAFGILRTSIDTQFPELFPAELEKLKESQDAE